MGAYFNPSQFSKNFVLETHGHRRAQKRMMRIGRTSLTVYQLHARLKKNREKQQRKHTHRKSFSYLHRVFVWRETRKQQQQR